MGVNPPPQKNTTHAKHCFVLPLHLLVFNHVEDSIFEDPGKKWSLDMLKCSRFSIACFTVDVTDIFWPNQTIYNIKS